MSRFDEIIDRKNTNSIKYDFAAERGKPEDILPLWVADMDFRAPEEVLVELHRVVDHGIFGYSQPKEAYHKAVTAWFAGRFGWKPEAEWLVKSPGVVFALSAAVRAFTEKGDAVMIQQPVYYPFASVISESQRVLVNNELVYENGTYRMDLQDFEKKAVENKVKLFILCSPHNPVGRVWTVEELMQIAKICLKHDIFVVSDEIHCDFTYPGHVHTVFASLSEEIAERCMICTAPSKTFNLAGLQTSNIFVKNREAREKLQREIYLTGSSELNTLGLAACRAAYEKGAPWLKELKEYLLGNLTMAEEFIRDRIPQIRVVKPEGTYLLWLDCSGLGMDDEELESFMVNEAKLWVDAGSMFGTVSGQFERINMTCPRSVLKAALEQLEGAWKSRKEGKK